MTHRTIWLAFFAFWAIATNLQAQGATCATATPFCTNTLDTFPAGVNQPDAPLGNNYDCLFTQPNPAWFTMNISQSGNISFTLDNTAGEDIDFIVWGPFTDIAAAQAACGNLGNGGASGNVAACSYSGAATELVEIPAAQAGEVYIMLVTNFSNQPTNIFSTSNTGSGSFACQCDIDVEFMLTPIPQNEGVMIDTFGNNAEFLLCGPSTPNGPSRQIFYTVRLGAPNATDSLALYAPLTNLLDVYGAGNFNIFSVYPVVGRYDSLEITVVVSPQNVNFDGLSTVGVICYGTNSCILPLNIRITTPTVEVAATDTSLCPAIAHQIQLNAIPATASNANNTGVYQWTQVQGAATTINPNNSANPTISIPATTSNGDVFRYALEYTDSTGCVAWDTVSINMQARTLAMEITADRDYLCSNGQPQTVQFNASVADSSVVASNGTFVWNNASTLSNPAIANPTSTHTINPPSAVDSVVYVAQFNYGACSAADTFVLHYRQTTVAVSPAMDTICPNESTQLQTIVANPHQTQTTNCNIYTVAAIPFAPVAGAGTPVIDFFSAFGGFPNDDDGISAALPIGFDFEFYCQNYTDFYIGTNGFVAFTLPLDNGTGGGTIPQAFDLNNLIAMAWADLDPGSGGQISYFTAGAAPNRRLVVNFNAVPHFGNPDSTATVQLVLYETSNIIELHNTSIQQDIFFSSMTQGVENAAGSAGTTPAGRNQGAFTARNDAFRFQPQIINATPTQLFAWSPSASLNNAAIANPIASPSATTTYAVTVTDAGCQYTASSQIRVDTTLAAPQVICGDANQNSITFTWPALAGAISYEYSTNGQTWTSTSNAFAVLTGLASGTNYSLQVRGVAASGECIFGYIDTATCNTSFCGLVANIVTTPVTACLPDTVPANGTLQVQVVAGSGPYSFQLAGVTQADSLFMGLAAGTYTVTVTENNAPACQAVITGTVASDIGDVRLAAYANLAGQNSITIFVGDTILLNAGYDIQGTSYLWSGAGTIFNLAGAQTSATFSAAGLYPLVVTASDAPCMATDTVFVQVNSAEFLGMPSAFTPNGDGENDRYRPAALTGAEIAYFRIFNRWGSKVYESQDFADGGWDGTLSSQAQPRDVYIYVFSFRLANGEWQELRGEFTLLR